MMMMMMRFVGKQYNSAMQWCSITTQKTILPLTGNVTRTQHQNLRENSELINTPHTGCMQGVADMLWYASL